MKQGRDPIFLPGLRSLIRSDATIEARRAQPRLKQPEDWRTPRRFANFGGAATNGSLCSATGLCRFSHHLT
jgi:hypothetical protein